MVTQLGAAAKISLVAIALLIAGSTSSAHAASRGRAAWPLHTVVVEKTTPPPGWAEFCRNYKSECEAPRGSPAKIALTPEVWDKLVAVDHWANAHIKPTPDRRHWGRPNKWTFAEDGRGDCKDYVLVKRRMLIQSGLPREALLITIVWADNVGHAVLIVRTNKGDYVLDNLSSKVVLWNQTAYDYVMRQTQSDPNAWVYIDGNPLKPEVVADVTIAENPIDEPTVLISGLDTGAPQQQIINADAENVDDKKHVANRSLDKDGPKQQTMIESGGAGAASYSMPSTVVPSEASSETASAKKPASAAPSEGGGRIDNHRP